MHLTGKIVGLMMALPLLLALSGNVCAQDISNGDIDKYGERILACERTGDWVMDKLNSERCIKAKRKKFDELLQTGEEAVKLSAELDTAYQKSSSLGAEDKKKLDRLEKLFNKIKTSLGAENDDKEAAAEEDKPSSVKAAFNALSERAGSLLSELKKTSRYSISVVAVQSTNTVLRLVRFLRFNKN